MGQGRLEDQALDLIKLEFDKKDMVLSQHGEEVSAYTFYEDIFGDTDTVVPVVMLDEEKKHIVPMSIEEAIEYSENRNDVLVGGCTYFNNWVGKKFAKDIYTFIIDMDNVYGGTLNSALNDEWRTANGEEIPMPTYIVNSGTGVHLYYVLKEPIPNYKDTTKKLDALYRALAVQNTTKRIFVRKQVQWFGQDFRMAGGLNKYEWKNRVYRVGKKWDIDDLGRSMGLEDPHFTRYGEKRVKTPQKTQKRRETREGWRSNRKFYEYAVRTCNDKTKEGNRYTSMCALSVIAWKCGVPVEELEKDLISLLPKYNEDATRLIKESEIYSAMKMYNKKAMLTQRSRLEDWQGWEYKPIKRNGRKRADHLRRARAVQNVDYPDFEWRNKNGQPSKQALVERWQAENPYGTKAECIRETGLNNRTVYKWWNDD